MSEIEIRKQILEREFVDCPYTRHDLLGNAACSRKIRDVIQAHILCNDMKSVCIDSLKHLMLASGVNEEDFNNMIVPEIIAFYRAKELIDNGYCDELKNQ